MHLSVTGRFSAWSVVVVLCWLLSAVASAHAEEISLDALVEAYPEFLASHDGEVIIWKDGTRMPVSDGNIHKTFDDRLRHASILDQLSTRYVRGPLEKPPGPQEDPGRFRNTAFFDKMYGDCSKREVQRKLTKVPWLPKSGGGFVQITTVNGVADRLRAISEELDALPPRLKKLSFPSAGTFNCRTVKDTGVRSMHAWGAAIDINTKFADYWLWGPKRQRLPKSRALRNRAHFREPWLHLGWQMGTLRYDALRVPTGAALQPVLAELADLSTGGTAAELNWLSKENEALGRTDRHGVH